MCKTFILLKVFFQKPERNFVILRQFSKRILSRLTIFSLVWTILESSFLLVIILISGILSKSVSCCHSLLWDELHLLVDWMVRLFLTNQRCPHTWLRPTSLLLLAYWKLFRYPIAPHFAILDRSNHGFSINWDIFRVVFEQRSVIFDFDCADHLVFEDCSFGVGNHFYFDIGSGNDLVFYLLWRFTVLENILNYIKCRFWPTFDFYTRALRRVTTITWCRALKLHDILIAHVVLPFLVSSHGLGMVTVLIFKKRHVT